ncbi:sensor histidine kinase [Cohnella sp. LGH]|uniref:sensor histidine kinase n=1 Tax=Cohnella sp. LGH TaxID=1619153 RepID=UPI001ADCFEE3|nr:sensor histidine kinase [Cohnella sp. LGH]QTH44039.1 sensor histidine kinase [Cohnella sp. LGH]
MLRTLWKNSIFSKLLLIFLLILIPLFSLGILLYNWGIGAVRTQLTGSIQTSLESILDNFDQDVQRTQALLFETLMNDEDLAMLALFPQSTAQYSEYEKFQMIGRLKKLLLAVKNSNRYIADVRIHVPLLNRTLSAAAWPESFRQDEYDDFSRQDERLRMVYRNDRPYIVMKTFNSKTDNAQPYFMIVVEFSAKELKDSLFPLLQYGNSGIYLRDDSSRFFVGTTNDDKAQSVEAALPRYGQAELAELKAAGSSYQVFRAHSSSLGLEAVQYVRNSELFQTIRIYRVWIWCYSLVGLLILALFSLYAYRYIHQPLVKMVRSFSRVENGDFNVFIKHDRNDEFQYLFSQFNDMVRNLNTLIDQSYRQRLLVQNAELKQLQSQINPHFLYNSLFILNTMTRTGDYDNLEYFTIQLGEYFRFMTKNNQDDISLGEEIRHARTYADIQSLRFGSRIKVVFDELPPAYAGLSVPRLIVQPVIENAFIHGLEQMPEKGWISISFAAEEDHLAIVVEDNGGSLSDQQLQYVQAILAGEAEAGEEVGLHNIHRRLQLKFGRHGALRLSRSTEGGLKAVILIPLEPTKERE